MQILIDTHILIWWWGNDPLLPTRLRGMIEAEETTVYVSAVCALELAIKVRLGKLPGMEHRIAQFHEGVRDDGFIHLNVHFEHALRAGSLPGDHRDPFDRVLAAQSLVEDLPLMSCDRQIATLGCKMIW